MYVNVEIFGQLLLMLTQFKKYNMKKMVIYATNKDKEKIMNKKKGENMV